MRAIICTLYAPRARTRLAPAAIAAVCCGALLASGSREPAPKFHAKTLDGEVFSNQTLQGKVVLLQFWTTWCPYCRKDQEAVDALVHDFTGRGLELQPISHGEFEIVLKDGHRSRVSRTYRTQLEKRLGQSL